jgi:hypothetical protein
MAAAGPVNPAAAARRLFAALSSPSGKTAISSSRGGVAMGGRALFQTLPNPVAAERRMVGTERLIQDMFQRYGWGPGKVKRWLVYQAAR